MAPAALPGSRVAFFGGSFDPPHRGHLSIAHAACAALELDRVLFAPVGSQPLKPRGSTASFDDRVTMTRLAIAGEPRFALSLADAPNSTGQPNFTYDTLVALRHELGASAQLFCLMGADSFLALRHWRRGSELPFLAPLIVASRPGESLSSLAAVLPDGLALERGCASSLSPHAVAIESCSLVDAAGRSAPFYLLPGLHIDTSATAIREEVRSESVGIPVGEGHHSDLPDAVFDYIAKHNLYR